ncbi:MAG: hypothetical protein H7Y36_02620 [Armatimonadetes bacterium]|nr:hypothetical protein [Akkermansiaceae bacterium]
MAFYQKSIVSSGTRADCNPQTRSLRIELTRDRLAADFQASQSGNHWKINGLRIGDRSEQHRRSMWTAPEIEVNSTGDRSEQHRRSMWTAPGCDVEQAGRDVSALRHDVTDGESDVDSGLPRCECRRVRMWMLQVVGFHRERPIWTWWRAMLQRVTDEGDRRGTGI